jgi:hypothetical protein
VILKLSCYFYCRASSVLMLRDGHATNVTPMMLCYCGDIAVLPNCHPCYRCAAITVALLRLLCCECGWVYYVCVCMCTCVCMRIYVYGYMYLCMCVGVYIGCSVRYKVEVFTYKVLKAILYTISITRFRHIKSASLISPL